MGGDKAQQPPVVRADDLPSDERDHAAGQVGGVVLAGATTGRQPVHWDLHPGTSGLLGPAGQPPFLPGAAWLILKPVKQLAQSALARLEVGVAVSGERQRQGPVDNQLAWCAGLPPDRAGPAGSRFWRNMTVVVRPPLPAGCRELLQIGRHAGSPPSGTAPNRVCRTSGR